jgi:hypothetical protein
MWVFSWRECVYVLGGDVIEAYVFTEFAKGRIVLSSILFVWCGLEVSSH